MRSGNVSSPAEYVRAYLAEIGRRGGEKGRRDLTRQHAKRMVEIREWKRATIRAGKSWPPTDRRSRRFLKLDPRDGRPTPTRAYRRRLKGERIRIPGWY